MTPGRTAGSAARAAASLAALLALILPTAASGCLWAGWVVEAVVELCRPAREHAREELVTELDWVRSYVDRNLEPHPERPPATVVVGRELRRANLELVDPDEWRIAESAEPATRSVWVLDTTEAVCGEELAPGRLVYLRVDRACCDVIPPEDAGCLVGADHASPLAPDLVAQLLTAD